MTPPVESPPALRPPAPLSAPGLAAALRGMGRSLAFVTDFNAFFAALDRAVYDGELLPGLRMELASADAMGAGGEFDFDEGVFNVPLVGRGELHGVMRVARRDTLRRFGAEDLHLLTALGSLVSGLLDHALNHVQAQRQLEMLRFVLDLAPVGFVVFDGGPRPVFVNAAARSWLGGADAVENAGVLADPPAPGAAARVYLRLEGRLISAETLASHSADGRPPLRVVVLADLTADQCALLDTLSRELYRARCEGQPLAFALLEHTAGRGTLLARLAQIRARIPAAVFCGPYDAHRIGMVLPGVAYRAALGQLRELRSILPEAETAAAVVTAAGATDREALLSSVLAGLLPLPRLLQPSILLHDDYPAVNDMLELVLRSEFQVTKSSSLGRTRELLAARSFDALVTELDLNEGVGGLELAREARSLQPEVRAVFTAAADRARCTEDDPLLRQSGFFGKPFVASQILAHLRAVLPR